MFFRKRKDDIKPIHADRLEFCWEITEIWDKSGKDAKIVKIDKVLKYREGFDKQWHAVYNRYKEPIYLENKIG